MTRGGVRNGAGRKTETSEAMERATVFLTPAMWEYIEKQGEGNRNAGLRKIVAAAVEGNLQSTAKTSRAAKREAAPQQAGDFTLTATHFRRNGRASVLPVSPQAFMDDYRRLHHNGGKGAPWLWSRKVRPLYEKTLQEYFDKHKLTEAQQGMIEDTIGAGADPD